MNPVMEKQRGAVLIISLVLLLVMTLLGLSAMDDTILQEKMAGNLRARNIALQAAESALRAGETAFDAMVKANNARSNTAGDSSGSTGVWSNDAPDTNTTNDDPWWKDNSLSWWRTNAVAYGTDLCYRDKCDSSDDFLPQQPRYVIEDSAQNKGLGGSLNVGTADDYSMRIYYYQITALGTGPADKAKVYLRSTFAAQQAPTSP